jgi:hypothetical protein
MEHSYIIFSNGVWGQDGVAIRVGKWLYFNILGFYNKLGDNKDRK